uniref:TEP1-F n=1 Tax=Anopheles atroparvus TaxID=41427 RepID=A0AAG5DPE4_ANOAO
MLVMRQIRSLVLAVALASLLTLSHGFLLLGPKFFRSNQDYTVVMSNFDHRMKDVSVIMRMEGSTDDGSEILNLTKTVLVRQHSNRVVNFEVPSNLPLGHYRLSINGKGDRSLDREISLIYLHKSLSGLIQLNKPVYKPGDSVLFRAIVLDSDLKPPVNVKTVQVTIEDPDGNVIRKWSKGRLHVGVFEGDLQISPVPTLGTYSIHLTLDGRELVSKAFQVKEYVLSSFDVNIFPNEIPLEIHQGLSLTVIAKYYTGQPVAGTAKVEVYLEDKLDQTKIFSLSGQKHMDFKFNKPWEMYEDEQVVHVTLRFTEKNTNETIVKHEEIVTYKHPYRVELIKNRPVFHHDVPYDCALRVQYQDGRPAKDIETLVEVTGATRNRDDAGNGFGQLYTSDREGLIKLRLHPSLSVKELSITVAIDENELFSEQIYKQDIGSAYIQVEPAVVTNTAVRLTIKCNEMMPFFLYYVISKGNIIDSGFVRPNGATTYSLELTAVAKMKPKSKVLVATVVDNVVVHDVVDVVFEALRNNFDLQMKKRYIEPGSPVEVGMIGSPGAYVALAAYDKSLLQHSKHHDLFWEDIMNTFNGFHDTSINEFDVFHSFGLFARSFKDVIFPFATDQSARDGQSAHFIQQRKLVSFRTNFLESWLWKNLTIGQQGHAMVKEKAPDTTTAWHLTGFSIDPVLGLGIIKRPIEFTTKQPFYIVGNLPYSIKRGEAVVLQFTVFNTYSSNLNASVTLYNVDNQTELVGRSVRDTSYTKSILALANAGVPVSFLIKPRKLGEMMVRVQATIDRATDTIEQIVRVEPESQLVQKRASRFFSHGTYINQTYALDLPVAIGPDAGSQKISFSLTPNLLTSVVENLENLLSVPSGCGEQNMVRFVPNLVVLDYLTAVSSKDQRVIGKATNLLRQGYQNQLKYLQADGSFGVWGKSGGSVFLTAFVGKSLQAASKYISEIEAKQVSRAYDWLASKQHSSGRYDEVGQVIHKDMQGGLRNGIALTAFVLSAFLEHRETTQKHAKVIDKGIQYITSNLQGTSDPYDLSLATYALVLRGHSSKNAFLTKLIGMAKLQNNGTEMFWERRSGGIETTAYALLSFVAAERYIDGTNIMRWLVKQRYATGSFPRTQDTFVGLRALTKLAEKISPASNDYSVRLRFADVTREFRVNSQDFSQMRHEEAVEDVRGMVANVAGMGFGLMEASYEYSVDLRNLSHQFKLELDKTMSKAGFQLDLRVCASFIPKLSDRLSNMVLVEVNFPSGYVIGRNPISNASRGNTIRNTEIRFGGTSIVVYYDNMGMESNCFTVTATRKTKVALKRPAYVLVHDYYEPELKAIKMYEVDSQNICDICEGDDCPSEC